MAPTDYKWGTDTSWSYSVSVQIKYDKINKQWYLEDKPSYIYAEPEENSSKQENIITKEED